MKRKLFSVFLALAIAFSLVSCGNTESQSENSETAETTAVSYEGIDFADNPDYKLVFEDNFDGDKLDKSIWGYEIGFIRNNEPQYYSDREKNVFVKDGKLNIVAYREAFTADDGTTANYTSGSINTKKSKSFKYGAIEMRAKLPKSGSPKATWPAFWMMGVDEGWPNGGETDILEMYGQHFDKYEANVHWGNDAREHTHLWDTDGFVPTFVSSDGDLGDQWRTYGVEWTPEFMRFYCDGTTLSQIDITGPDQAELREQANYILLNMALQPQYVEEATDDQFPITYQVDYVRVYQKK